MLAIVAVAILSRVVTYGNPVVIADDQFYLLVGDAMRHGQSPYLDIWDRKPYGLFALFEGIAAIGGGSILAMQLTATAFAAATALIIRRLALFVANGRGALFAALAYLLTLPLIGGDSGQSPVFYNLFTALAGWALFSAVGRAAPAITARAFAAMLACGLAMAVKPVALVEGIFFGLAFVALLHRARIGTARIVPTALAMMGLALLPTVLPLVAFALKGRAAFDRYAFANYQSIFHKHSYGATAQIAGFEYFLLYAGPLILISALGAWRRRADFANDMRLRLAVAWLVAAIGGWVLVPNFFDHYALPLLVPLALLTALGFGHKNGLLYIFAFAVLALLDGRLLDWPGNRRAIAEYNRLSSSVEAARHGGCLFVAEGPDWLYKSSGACRLTPYLFAGHLTFWNEAEALGVDQRTELARVLAARPAVIVTQPSEAIKRNPAIRPLLEGTLAMLYRPVLALPRGERPLLETVTVWQRRDLAPPPRR